MLVDIVRFSFTKIFFSTAGRMIRYSGGHDGERVRIYWAQLVGVAMYNIYLCVSI